MALVRLEHILEAPRGGADGETELQLTELQRDRASAPGVLAGDGRLVRGSSALFPFAARWSQPFRHIRHRR